MYLDTSVLIPLFVHEPNSSAIERWMESVRFDSVTISDWALVEFASAVGRKVRERQISAGQAGAHSPLIRLAG